MRLFFLGAGMAVSVLVGIVSIAARLQAPQALETTEVHIETTEADIEKEIEKFPKVSGATPLGQVYIAPRLKTVMEKAYDESVHLTDEFISVEHLLLAIINGNVSSRGVEYNLSMNTHTRLTISKAEKSTDQKSLK